MRISWQLKQQDWTCAAPAHIPGNGMPVPYMNLNRELYTALFLIIIKSLHH